MSAEVAVARPAPDPLLALARRTDPADAGAQNNLGVLLHRRGRPEAALHAFSRALALDPAMRLARRNIAAAADGADGARRESELRTRVRQDGADMDARRELARLLSALGRHDAARAELDALIALAPDSPGVHVERARAEQAAGDVDGAAAALERARALAPTSATIRALLAHVTYHAGDPAAALSHVEDALRLGPDDADAHLLHGFLLGEMGRPEEGDAARARAVALNPALGRADANLALAPTVAVTSSAAAAHTGSGEPPDAHLVLGAAFRHKGYHDEALREYRRAASLGASEIAITRAVGELHLLRGVPVDAIAPWTRLTALAPDDASAWLGRAGAAHLAGRPSDARAAYMRAIALAPAESDVAAWAQNGMGALCWATGDVVAAARAFEHAARLPGAVVPRLNLAATLSALGEGGRALAIAREAVRAAPERAAAWTLLGRLLADAARPSDARSAFARALDLDGQDVAARYGLAFAAAALGEHDVARRETERALAQSPIVPGRRLHLVLDLGGPAEFAIDAPDVAPAGAAIDGFALDEAAADALVAELLAPRVEIGERGATAEAAHPYALADEHLAHGDVERAEAAVGRAMTRGGDRAEGLARLGVLFARRGLHGEALERFAEARALAPGLRLAVLGEVRALRELGRMSQARDASDVAAAAWPHDDEALALAALAHADAGDADGAERLLARAAPLLRAAAAWRDVAAANRALGDAPASVVAQRRVVALCPSDSRERLALAHAERSAGASEEAERTLQALLADVPTLADASLALAALRVAAGAHRDAVPLLAAVAARDPWHVDALALLGATLADVGRTRDAAVAASRARRLDPEHALALAVEGDCRCAVGQRARARV
ncbi:MAG: tetratricopeptide repeat protein, partial [Gemmatirosa sp.]